MLIIIYICITYIAISTDVHMYIYIYIYIHIYIINFDLDFLLGINCIDIITKYSPFNRIFVISGKRIDCFSVCESNVGY